MKNFKQSYAYKFKILYSVKNKQTNGKVEENVTFVFVWCVITESNRWFNFSVVILIKVYSTNHPNSAAFIFYIFSLWSVFLLAMFFGICEEFTHFYEISFS